MVKGSASFSLYAAFAWWYFHKPILPAKLIKFSFFFPFEKVDVWTLLEVWGHRLDLSFPAALINQTWGNQTWFPSGQKPPPSPAEPPPSLPSILNCFQHCIYFNTRYFNKNWNLTTSFVWWYTYDYAYTSYFILRWKKNNVVVIFICAWA